MDFSYEYTIIENTENIPLNLKPIQNALFQALRLQCNLDIPKIIPPGEKRPPKTQIYLGAGETHLYHQPKVKPKYISGKPPSPMPIMVMHK